MTSQRKTKISNEKKANPRERKSKKQNGAWRNAPRPSPARPYSAFWLLPAARLHRRLRGERREVAREIEKNANRCVGAVDESIDSTVVIELIIVRSNCANRPGDGRGHRQPAAGRRPAPRLVASLRVQAPARSATASSTSASQTHLAAPGHLGPHVYSSPAAVGSGRGRREYWCGAVKSQINYLWEVLS